MNWEFRIQNSEFRSFFGTEIYEFENSELRIQKLFFTGIYEVRIPN